VAADDPEIRGVAAMSPPADFADWAADAPRFLETCRDLGVVRAPDFPADFAAWAQELKEVRAIAAIDHIPPRPILLVHGTDDDVVSMADARALADAAEDQIELRLINGAGHRLRHDPRAVAVLLGWLDRQVL
jgi:putative redox protein